MSKKSLDLHIPTQETLDTRFASITNQTLRGNIAIAFRYIIFLISLESEYELPAAISYSLFKDVILYTCSIVESCTHYCLKECIDTGHIRSSDIMPNEWKDDSCVELYKISENQSVFGGVKHKKPEKFTSKTQLHILNGAALKSGLFTRDLYERADKLRTQRNNIHLVALEKIDDLYEKKDIQEAFESAKLIINRIEEKLSEIRGSSIQSA